MERLAHLADQVHDAAIALEQLLFALDRHHRKPTGADGFKIDEEYATELVAMRCQEGLHTGAITIRGARCHKPDIVTEQLIIAHRGDSREHIFGRSAVGRRSAALPAIVIVLEVIPRTDTATGLLGIVIVFDAQPVTHAVLLVFLFTAEQTTQAALTRLGCRRGGSRNGLDRLCARRNGHRKRNGCRCGFGALGSSKGIVDLCGGVRDATFACFIDGSDGSGTEASGDEEGAGDGADAGSGTFICGRGDAREEIWAIRESTVSSWVGATLATVAPEPLGVGMVKICVE